MSYDRDFFFDAVRESLFGGKMVQSEVDGLNVLLDEWEELFEKEAGAQSTPWLAYCLATSHHETGFTHQPVAEIGGASQPYGQINPETGEAYWGRGHVQLTHRENYAKSEKLLLDEFSLEKPLEAEPDIMLEEPETSAIVMFAGCESGIFTGACLDDFFNDTTENPYDARTIVNGHDRAETIVGYYDKFKAALRQVEDEDERNDAA